ncbi:alpha-1,2-mannosidase [Microbacterium murale]|uniref:Alpha-1,2-mannosidase n=1 Tax=Microbacterium murale TaxID=1081040 RepID=A0ABQ1RXF0_9MICO|nr:alpha-1,2-mannosidase [Microbacterium murale]
MLTGADGTGFSDCEPWRIDAARGEDRVVRRLPGVLAGSIVSPGDELAWIVLPVGTEDTETRFEATAVAVDVLFDDGRWLSETGLADQYGGGSGAREQGEARRLWPDQWNLRRISIDSLAGKRVVETVAVLRGSQHRAVTAYVDGVSLSQHRSSAESLQQVDTRRGTHSSPAFSRGNTAPLVGLPHGGVFGLPMTDASAVDWAYTYAASGVDRRPALQAFATSHISSPWMKDYGVFQLMPSALRRPDTGREARALTFDRFREDAGAHRYRVEFDGGIVAELTASDFAVALRTTFPGDDGSIVLDHAGVLSDVDIQQDGDVWMLDAALESEGEKPRTFVHVRIADVATTDVRVEAGRLNGFVTVHAGRVPVDAIVGHSSVDVAHARANALHPGGFDAMLEESARRWQEALDMIVLDGATQDQRVSVMSGLYRALLYPTKYGEPALDRAGLVSRSPYDGALVKGIVSASNGFWDTYRTAWPLLTLLQPDAVAEHAEGFLAHVDASGWTPRWSAPAAEDCMTGTTFDLVFADLVVKSVRGLDLERGYAAARKNALVPAEDPRVGRKGLVPAIFRGFVSTEVLEGLSWTLDSALNDAGISRIALLLAEERHRHGRKADPDLEAEAEYFAQRSMGYAEVFDRERGFFIGRNADGSWRGDFDPREWGHDYTETTAWGTAFTAPHDGAGLARLHGGEEALGRALDQMLREPETASAALHGHYPYVIHEMREARDVRSGMLALSNQPAHHIPFMYMFSGRHDDAHALVHDALSRLFVGSDFGQGYPGDEDNGEMSAWYIFATIGLYPLVPASGTYVLVPPSVQRTKLAPSGGQPIEIVVCGGQIGDRFIRRVRVDGVEWNSISIDHATLARGCVIEFDLSSTATGWAADSRPYSASDGHGNREPMRDLAESTGTRGSIRRPELLTDDLGAEAVTFAADDDAEISLTAPAVVSFLTVTAATPDVAALRIELLDRDGRVHASRHIGEPGFEWPGETRVLRAPGRDSGVVSHALRIIAEGPARLTQIQVFGLSGPWI